MLYRPHASSEASTAILAERIVVDLIDDLEAALAIIESTERRARSPASSSRLNTAARVVDATLTYLRELRG
jgi:hypothetical protein